ncbi:MAG: hypothetical protein F2911_12000, partial [Actinobacteria bacterium]|nr:hypothetical protein [Actinomycetota bacterium]
SPCQTRLQSVAGGRRDTGPSAPRILATGDGSRQGPLTSISRRPGAEPTRDPTRAPTRDPTRDPTREPTRAPTREPTRDHPIHESTPTP